LFDAFFSSGMQRFVPASVGLGAKEVATQQLMKKLLNAGQQPFINYFMEHEKDEWLQGKTPEERIRYDLLPEETIVALISRMWMTALSFALRDDEGFMKYKCGPIKMFEQCKILLFFEQSGTVRRCFFHHAITPEGYIAQMAQVIDKWMPVMRLAYSNLLKPTIDQQQHEWDLQELHSAYTLHELVVALLDFKPQQSIRDAIVNSSLFGSLFEALSIWANLERLEISQPESKWVIETLNDHTHNAGGVGDILDTINFEALPGLRSIFCSLFLFAVSLLFVALTVR
jgi:hypothetical protein